MRFIVFLVCVFNSQLLLAAPALVDTAWLSQHMNDKSLRLLDIRPKQSFDIAHIPNSVNSDYANWRQPRTKVLQKMLPSRHKLNILLKEDLNN